MPGVGTVDRGGVAPATKTFPSTDYKGSGWPEIVVEIRGPTTSHLLQPGGRGSPDAIDVTITQKHYTMNPKAAAIPASVGLKDSSSSSCVSRLTSVPTAI